MSNGMGACEKTTWAANPTEGETRPIPLNTTGGVDTGVTGDTGGQKVERSDQSDFDNDTIGTLPASRVVGAQITTATTTLVVTAAEGVCTGLSVNGGAGGTISIYAGITAVNLIATQAVAANETITDLFAGFPFTTGLTIVTSAAINVTPTYVVTA